jgi:membrane-bound lytic murein transglycosylase B
MKKKLILIILFITNIVFAESVMLQPVAQDFIESMVKQHNFEKKQLELLLNKYSSNPIIIEKISNPTEKLNWGEYKKLLISDRRINRGKQFLLEHQDILLKAQKQFLVPKEIITAILGIESFYGEVTGKYPVLQALVTLAFDYPPRAKFFKSELENFLLLTREEHLDPINIMGSYAGAMSPAQFISSSYRAYAVDFAGIGSKDLNNIHNVIGSIANYFKKHGWKNNDKVAVKLNNKNNNKYNKHAVLEFITEDNNKEHWVGFNNFYVITKYNNSHNYAMAVYLLAKKLGLEV